MKSVKYWETEEPVVTSTENAELRFFPENEKLQIFAKYSSDPETGVKDKIGRGAVLNLADIASDDEKAELMSGFIEAFFNCDRPDPRSLLDSFVSARVIPEDALSGDFQDDASDDGDESDDVPDYDSMTLAELRQKCKELGLDIKSKKSKEALVELIREAEKPADDNDDEASGDYSGKYIGYSAEQGIYVTVKKKDRAYKDAIEVCANAKEYLLDICQLAVDSISKKGRKRVLNADKLMESIAEFIEGYEADDDINAIFNEFAEMFRDDISEVDFANINSPEAVKELISDVTMNKYVEATDKWSECYEE